MDKEELALRSIGILVFIGSLVILGVLYNGLIGLIQVTMPGESSKENLKKALKSPNK